MSYEVILHPQVMEFIKNALPELKDRIRKKLLLLKETPFYYLEHFEGEYYKLRIGDYRALIDINFEKHLIIVQLIDHRNRVYK